MSKKAHFTDFDISPFRHYTYFIAIVYSVTNQKGEVGRTTICMCPDAVLIEQEYRTLTVDFDPQAGLSSILGL
ncbi:MAG TPA: AAA family ATPase [Candidatus Ratteibacteria bacterium]|nr:AAA family ATPase [Candidatus Ratteibacteria bacterium]HRV05227.1 AAA family ATPase [Candidatus Ratteibacteria bacterium]